MVIEHYQLTAKEYNILQNYARYCSKNKIEHDSVLYLLSDQEFSSFKSRNKIKFQRNTRTNRCIHQSKAKFNHY